MELEAFKTDLSKGPGGDTRRHSEFSHVSFRGYEELHKNHPPTSYAETMMNLFKGNVRLKLSFIDLKIYMTRNLKVLKKLR